MTEQDQFDDQGVYAVDQEVIQDVHSLRWARTVKVSVNRIGGKSLAPHDASGG